MDDLDHKILQLLAENARMPVKDIAQRVSLTSPAVQNPARFKGRFCGQRVAQNGLQIVDFCRIALHNVSYELLKACGAGFRVIYHIGNLRKQVLRSMGLKFARPQIISTVLTVE